MHTGGKMQKFYDQCFLVYHKKKSLLRISKSLENLLKVYTFVQFQLQILDFKIPITHIKLLKESSCCK
jgi:hypothetical protein